MTWSSVSPRQEAVMTLVLIYLLQEEHNQLFESLVSKQHKCGNLLFISVPR